MPDTLAVTGHHGHMVFGRRAERLRVASEEAFAAKSAAAAAFIALDTNEDQIQAQVHSFAQLDQGPAGERMRADLSPLLEQAQVAIAAYLSDVEAHPIDGDVKLGELKTAKRAFTGVLRKLQAADGELTAFAGRIAPALSELDSTLHELAGLRQVARQELERARLGVTSLAATGLKPRSVQEKLTEAERRWRAVSVGPGAGRDGLAEAMKSARAAADASAAVRSAAAAYVQLVSDTRDQLSTVAERLTAVSVRVEPVLAKLSDLRRRYARGCSEDLDYVREDARECLDEAKSALVTAERLAKRNIWDDAATALSNARRRIDQADRDLRAVDNRVRQVEQIAANPRRTTEDAWTEVKKAQRFVVAANGGPSPDEVRELDALAARLEEIPNRLAGPHPDYWSYATEARTISAEANEVLARARKRLSSSGG